MRKPKQKPAGKWVFVPQKDMTPEEIQQQLEDDVDSHLQMQASFGLDMEARWGLVRQREDFLPGKNKVPEGGAWILIKDPPNTEYTVPPMSVWFAEPWPHREERLSTHRVKILTPKGELGIYPREYSLIEDPGKYYEFIGQGMEIKFFGNEEGVPKDKLFYLRSRGISKAEALSLLIGSIKAHGVLWIEATRETVSSFGMDFPPDERNATLAI